MFIDVHFLGTSYLQFRNAMCPDRPRFLQPISPQGDGAREAVEGGNPPFVDGWNMLEPSPVPGKTNKDTLWLFNIAMENGPFIDGFPIETSIYEGLSMAMLNNQIKNGI